MQRVFEHLFKHMDQNPSTAFDPIRHIKRTSAARRVNRTAMTLRRWEAAGRLQPIHFNSRLVGYERDAFEMFAQEIAPLQPAILQR